MSELIISVSGLRGIVGETLTPPVAARYLAAFCNQLTEPGPVVLSYDGRTSGPMLRDLAAAAIVACGRDVLDAGVAATPTVGVLVKQFNAAGAVQISASHNPPAYNGIKLFSAAGRVLDAASGAKVRELYLNDSISWKAADALGSCCDIDDPHASHLDAVLATVDVEAIRKRNFSVVLDSNHGSGSTLGRRLLEALGCRVIVLGDEPNGLFAHPPEPLAENLQGVCETIKSRGCDVGFCQDPDADRLALIDAAGKFIGEEYTVAMCVQRAMMKQPGPIVINLATSSMSQQVAIDAGATPYRSAVGEANVADMMIANAAVYGGEGNGGPIDPAVGYVRDSFVGMAHVLELMATTGKSIAELAAELPRFEIYKAKAEIGREALPAAMDQIAAELPDAEVSRIDGLRLSWSDRWLLVRGSNTEPIVRFIAEAPTLDEAKALCDRAEQIVNACT
ncbi:phosphoglucosamine mutase [Rosistilla oblonga]|uniref:phosphoglucosamine mutase n=1 Tax=Rosistilla oblonga TaxID=2527990 RepID=UPI003A970E17